MVVAVDIVCFFIFLFVVYQLAKEDFIFLRKGVDLEHIFNAIFLGFPLVLIVSRLMYILLHPSSRFLNPLVFFALPYFPGLSLVGGIIGAWIFANFYAMRNKIAQGRLLDMLGIAFILSFSIGMFFSAIFMLFSHTLLGIGQIGESMLGIVFSVFLLTDFLKGNHPEGTISLVAIVFYCLLSFVSVGLMLLSHMHILQSSLIVTGILFVAAVVLLVINIGFGRRILKK